MGLLKGYRTVWRYHGLLKGYMADWRYHGAPEGLQDCLEV